MEGGILRRVLILLAKFAVAFAVLYWLIAYGQLDLHSLVAVHWNGQNLLLFAAGFAAILVALALMALRFKELLAACGIPLSFHRAWGLTAIGAVTTMFLPGVFSGDAVRSVYLGYGEARTQRSSGVGVIVVDRVIGLFALLLLGSLTLAITAALGRLPFWSWVLMVAPAGVVAVGVGTAGIARVSVSGVPWLGRHYGRLPRLLRTFFSTFRQLARQPRVLLFCVVLSFFSHALTCTTFVLAAALLGESAIPWLNQFLLGPLALAMNAIPLTPGGIGIAESVLSYLYEAAGYGQGANVGLLGRLIQYAACIVAGALAFVFLPSRPHPAPDRRPRSPAGRGG
jgi:uncharacterized protein (TIRG00374 family)